MPLAVSGVGVGVGCVLGRDRTDRLHMHIALLTLRGPVQYSFAIHILERLRPAAATRVTRLVPQNPQYGARDPGNPLRDTADFQSSS